MYALDYKLFLSFITAKQITFMYLLFELVQTGNDKAPRQKLFSSVTSNFSVVFLVSSFISLWSTHCQFWFMCEDISGTRFICLQHCATTPESLFLVYTMECKMNVPFHGDMKPFLLAPKDADTCMCYLIRLYKCYFFFYFMTLNHQRGPLCKTVLITRAVKTTEVCGYTHTHRTGFNMCVRKAI